MDLFDAHRQGLPLVIDTGDGGERLMAEVFPLPEFGGPAGVVFADIGWPDTSGQPFHVVQGAITEDEDGWQVGDRQVRIAFDGELLYESWRQWLDTDASKSTTSAECAAEIKRSGYLEPAGAT